MNLKLLLPCIVMVFFFSLNAEDDQNKPEQPEWFTKFQQEYTSSVQRQSSDKWCAMFKCLPEKVKEKLTDQLGRREIEYRLFSIPLYQRTLYKYAIYTASLNKSHMIQCIWCCGFPLIQRLFRKRYLRNAIAQLVKSNEGQVFSDEYEQKSFKVMLEVLQKEVGNGWYPGWNVEKCAECCFEVVNRPTVY